MMNDQVRTIMTKDPVVVGPNTTVSDVTKVMLDNRLQQLPVVQEGKLMGLVTSYDLWKRGGDLEKSQETPVSQIMNTNVLKITPLDKVGTAAELFMDKRFKTLPVVNLRNELKGVVTAFDVIRHALVEEYPRPILYADVVDKH